MEMPKVGDAHRNLGKLVGSWSGEEKMHPSPWDPQGGTAVGRVVNRAALDGFIVTQDYEQERGGQISFRGHGVFSWDAPKEDYVLHWFDTMGMPPNVFRGRFEGSVLTLASSGPQGHSRTVFDFSASNRYTFKMEMSPDGGQWHPMMEGSYLKHGKV